MKNDLGNTKSGSDSLHLNAGASEISLTLDQAANEARFRLWLISLFQTLGSTWWHVLGFLLIPLWVGHLWHQKWAVLAAIVVVVAWVVGLAFWTWYRRPGSFEALAAWDEAGGRREALASAWFFETKGAKDEGSLLHLQRARTLLSEERSKLSQQLPLPTQVYRAVFPILALSLFAVSPLAQVIPLGDQPLSEEAEARAREEKERLEKALNADKMEGLSPQEKDELAALQESLKETAEDLADPTGKSTREVLSELEKRAREAEKLAQKLGADGGDWASEEMLSEMRQHADTADLADASRDKKAQQAAEEAERLARELGNESLTNEVKDRLTSAFSKIQEAANEEDEKRVVGGPSSRTGEHLRQQDAKSAASELSEMAENLKRLAQRQKSQQELQKLADQLRQSGGNIAGSQGQMNKLESGQQGQGSQQAQTSPGMNQMNSNQLPQSLNPPGFGSSSQSQTASSPQDQQGQQGGSSQSQSPVPGEGISQSDLFNQSGGGSQMGQSTFQTPIPGAGQMPSQGGGEGQGNGQGMGSGAGKMDELAQALGAGLMPGVGTAELNGSQSTRPLAPAENSMVGTAITPQGESATRQIQGGEKTDVANLSTQEVVRDTLRVEEDALDEAALPAARREQVRRYFTLLRERFKD